MPKKPRVSVLTPIYNTNIEHLRQCIDSILNQTFTDFEFIILNDSPDNKKLKKIIDTYEDNRIKYYENKKNIGISESRNRLLQLARGEYIAIFDHDDISVPDRLARQVEFLDTHPNIGVVSGWLQCFGDRNDIWKNPETDIEIKLALTENCYVAHTAAMIRKSILDEHNIKYEEQYSPAEDYRLWTQLMDFTDFHNIQTPLVRYRWHATNTSIKQQNIMQKTWQNIKTETIKKYPSLRIGYERYILKQTITNKQISDKRKFFIKLLCSCIFIAKYRRNLRNKLLKNNLPISIIDNERQTEFVKDLKIFSKIPNNFSFKKQEKPLVSIIIPVYNQYKYTIACLYSILQHTDDVDYEIIVADDNSNDKTKNLSQHVKNITIIRNNTNLRFLKNCNNAAKYARGKYILFLNNDTQVQKNWLKPLLDLIEKDSSIGMVGSQLLFPDFKLQEAGGIIWSDGSGWNFGRGDYAWKDEYNYVKEVDYISGASIMLPTELWKNLNGFDNTFAPAYYEDTDLAFRIRERGLKVMYQPLSKVIHFEGKSNGTNTTTGQKKFQIQNCQKFIEKWHKTLDSKHSKHGDVFIARDRSQNKKTLLFIDENILTFDKDCGSRASFQYINMFIKNNINVKYLPRFKGPQDYHLTTLRQSGAEVICSQDWFDMQFISWIQENGKNIDFIYLNRPLVAIKYFDLLRKYTKAKIIYQGHDLHYLRMKREYDLNKKNIKDIEKMEAIENSIINKVDVVTYFSDAEIKILKELFPKKNMQNVPLYMFDKSEIKTNYDAQKRTDIMFIGGYNHTPNKDAALWLVNNIMPLVWEKNPDIKLHLIGSNPPNEILALSSNKIIIHGYVSDEDLDKIYNDIKLSVVPLRYGAGVKGKILESIKNSVPVITTDIGIEGIPNKNEFIIVKNTEQEIAQAIVDLYPDNKKLNKISKNCLPFISKNYSESATMNLFNKWLDIK